MPSTIVSSSTSVLASRAAVKNFMGGGPTDHMKGGGILSLKKSAGLNVRQDSLGMGVGKVNHTTTCSLSTAADAIIKVEMEEVSLSSMEAMKEVKQNLTKDLKVLLDEFTRFQQAAAMAPEVSGR